MAVSLPPEIWLAIFSWLVSSSEIYSSVYAPFQSCPSSRLVADLRDRSALVRVCRSWRDLSAPLLYRDIIIKYSDSNTLRQLFETSRYRDLVQRVVLPYTATSTHHPSCLPLQAIQILALCSQLEVLVRPRSLVPTSDLISRFEYDADALPPLESLRRIEWWQHSEAERSGGINSLVSVVHKAPGLRYLLIGCMAGVAYSRLTGQSSKTVKIPALRTLRLHSVPALFLYQLSNHWSMPQLTHVAIDSPESHILDGLNSLWEARGPQLQTVEFGRHLRFLTYDHISPCLERCINLKELNYYIFFSQLPEIGTTHISLISVSLNCWTNEMYRDHSSKSHILSNHLDKWLSGSFPDLQSINIVGKEHLLSSQLPRMEEKCENSSVDLILT